MCVCVCVWGGGGGGGGGGAFTRGHHYFVLRTLGISQREQQIIVVKTFNPLNALINIRELALTQHMISIYCLVTHL